MSAHPARLVCSLGLASLLLSACTSVSSKVQAPHATLDDGIIYYMPMRPIIVTVTVDAQGHQTPSVQAGDYVPDLRHRFVLSYEQNYVGTNHLAIGVNANGLLTSSNGTTQSGVKQIVESIAKTIAATSTFAVTKVGKPKECENSKTYSEVFWPEDIDQIVPLKAPHVCDFYVSITRLLWTPESLKTVADKTIDTARLGDTHAQSGLFYRQNLPYLVVLSRSATDKKGQSEAVQTSSYIALSPDEAPIGFVPVTRTLFSDNKANITLDNGIVTAVDQSSDGEVVALAELPADFISAYFTAVGTVFSGLSGISNDKASLLEGEQSNALAKVKLANCQAAIAANPLTMKSSEERNKAVAAIKDACS